jgi:splicing factor 3A subunit 3
MGIPNTAHFANITLIEDAVQLWEKLKVSREEERFKPDVEV